MYTDGACRGNPGPGGWGVFMRYGDQERTLSGSERHTTNNRMEMLAAIRGLEALKRPTRVRLLTDSRYVQQGITEWIVNWRRKNWKTAAGKPVKNVDLWQQLDQLTQHHDVRWEWVKGHAGNAGNEAADSLATSAIDRMIAGSDS